MKRPRKRLKRKKKRKAEERKRIRRMRERGGGQLCLLRKVTVWLHCWTVNNCNLSVSVAGLVSVVIAYTFYIQPIKKSSNFCLDSVSYCFTKLSYQGKHRRVELDLDSKYWLYFLLAALIRENRETSPSLCLLFFQMELTVKSTLLG